MDLDPLQVAGIDGRGGLDHAQGPVGKLDRGQGHVLDGDPLMGQPRGLGPDLDHGSHQPGEQIDAVNGLVHEGPAAVEFPGAAPRAAVVIGLAAIPLHVGVAEGQPPEASAVDRPLQLLAGVVEPRGEDGREHDARTAAGLDDLVAAAERDLQRLLDDHVLARPRGGDGRLLMGPAGRADGDDVDGRVGQHVVELVIGLAAGRLGQLIGRRRNLVETGHQLGPANVGNRLRVELCNHPATNNAKTEHSRFLLK